MTHWFSHFGQDAWASQIVPTVRDGYFLDVGAFDGVTHSNTYTLERDFGWRGICLEPNPDAYEKLCASRRSITLPFAAYKERGKIKMANAGGLSSLEPYINCGKSAARRLLATQGYFTAEAQRLSKLAERFGAPVIIDYLSLDTEGAELEILREWFNGRHELRFRCATIEHGFERETRSAVRELMKAHGYLVIDQNERHDDYFWHPDLIARRHDPVLVYHHIQKSYENLSA